MIITIDGPVASGKSTAARNLAEALGFEHLDSGALYRAVALLALREGIDPGDSLAVGEMLASADIRYEGKKTFLGGQDVSEEIRLPELTRSVKPFAENPQVRDFVNSIKRRFAEGKNVVVEGRDIGTVVFPEADLKLFLTASEEERARRRADDLVTRGTPRDVRTVLDDLRKRDEADTGRDLAPLKQAKDAILIDSTGLSQDETLARLLDAVRRQLGESL